jgi:hypothetical protein
MARKRPSWLMRLGVAVTSWVAVLSVAQAVLGPELAGAAKEVEERIELQLRGLRAPPDPQPERSHEDESFEPWELVSV